MNIYVGNLNFKVEESELNEMFSEYGNVESVKIISDKFSGRSKGFGFVVMEDSTDAEKAINELNGSMMKDRSLVVNEAKPRE